MTFLRAINPNLQFYKNYKDKEIKKIISGKYEDIISNEILKNYFNKKTYSFNYIEKYNNLYQNVSNPNIIINSLFNNESHNELNLISYYNLKKNIDDNTNIIGKYLISILKSLYIDNYFFKKRLIYIRFILFHENECFIYPPDAYNNTESFIFTKSNLNSTNFPYSFFSYLNSFLKDSYFFYTIKNGEYLIICLSISYYFEIDFTMKNNVGYICLELNIGNLFKSFIIEKKTKLEVFTVTNEDLSIIHFDGRNIDNSILKNIFNSNFVLYEFKENSKKTFFHLLYFDLLESYSKYVNVNDILDEYKSIYNITINEIRKFINLFKLKSNEENNTIDFYINKTSCQKKMDKNSYICGKEQFLVIIEPFIVQNVMLDNNFFILFSNTVEYQILFYSIAVFAINEEFTKKKVIKIFFMKILKVTLYFLFICISAGSFICLLLMLIFRGYFNGLDNMIKELEKFLFYLKNKSTSFSLSKLDCSLNK